MSENNQGKKYFEKEKAIFIEDCSPEVIVFLKKNNVKFKVWDLTCLKKEYYDPEEESPLIEIETELYQKLNKLSEITGIPVKNIASRELGDFFNSVGDIPVIFLDSHLGIENIKNPIEMLSKMKDVIHIPEGYLKSLKTKKDLMKEVEDWYKPFKKPK